MSSTPIRRSARAPKPNPRYEDEVPWSEDTLRLLRHESNSSDRSSTSEGSQLQVDQDVEMEDVQEEEQSEVEEPPLLRNRSSTDDVQNPPSRIPSGAVPAITKHKSAKTSFRLSKKEVYPQIFGPGVEDLYPILQTRDIWHLNPRDVVFPSRASLTEAIRLHSKNEYLEQQQKQESIWVIEDYQRTKQITRERALAEKYLEIGESHDIVLGPIDRPQKYTLAYQEPFQIATAWLRSRTEETVPPSLADIDNAYRKGWILNLGARPTCLAWTPSSTDDQYLAVTFRCSKSQRDTAPPPQTKLAPAFSSSPAYPSRIEIWRIKGIPTDVKEPAQLDYHTPPRLVQVVCVKYGNVLKMEWLPSVNESDECSLCILTTDGNIRILRLRCAEVVMPIYLQINEPQHIANAPTNTVFTSFTLPNSCDLIAADAAGAIHLFSLASNSKTLTPYASLQIHMTYIMSISSIPSHPQFVCTSSAAGEYILTDLRCPDIDRVRVQSARLPTRNLSYLPFTRTFLTTLDSAGRFESTSFAGSTVISHNLRDFKLAKPVLRLPDTGGVATCLACSPLHPIIAVGNASGSVFTSNYVRRCLPIANAKDGVGAWMVKLFGYEWRKLTEDEKAKKRKEHVGGTAIENQGSTGPQTDHTRTETGIQSISQQQQNGDSIRVSPMANSTLIDDTVSDPNPAPHNPDLEIDLYHGSSKPKPGISRISEAFRPYQVVLSKLEIARTKGTAKKVNGQRKPKSKGKGTAKVTPKKRGRPRKNRDSDNDNDGVDETEDDEQEAGNTHDKEGQGQAIYHEEQAVSCMAWNGCHVGTDNVRFSSWLAVGWGSGIVRIVDLGHDVV